MMKKCPVCKKEGCEACIDDPVRDDDSCPQVDDFGNEVD